MIRRLSDNELVTLQPLFEEVFKHSISLELLKWKYADQRGESWVVENESGRIVMHCGLGFRTVLIGGEKVQAAQLIDLMAPAKSLGLTRRDSPFAKLMNRILRDLHRPSNTAGIAFGFPSDRAMRLGEHMGVYREVDRVMRLEFTPQLDTSGRTRCRQLLHIGKTDRLILDSLWADMAKDLSEYSIGVRDANYVTHRYLEHPDKDYTVLVIEKTGFWRNVPIGLAVVGSGTQNPELLDIVCSSKNVQPLMQSIRHWLVESNIKNLHLSLTERFSAQFRIFAASCELTQFRIMGNSFTPTVNNTFLDRRWWLTGGDTDYR